MGENINSRESNLFQKKIKQYTLGPGMKDTEVSAKNSSCEVFYSYARIVSRVCRRFRILISLK